MAKATALDRLIAYVSPGTAVRRLAARTAFEAAASYKGASRTRDALSGWKTEGGAPDDQIGRDLPTLRERSDWLIKNNPMAAGAVHTKAQGIVGTGLKLNASVDREYLGISDAQADAFEDTIEFLFRTWAESKDCHIKRTLNFYEQQEVSLRCVLSAGDHFVQLSRATASSLPFTLALQHIAAERVSNPDNKRDTDTLVQGISKTALGAPEAIHVANHYPGSVTGSKRTWETIPFFVDGGRRRVTLHLYRALSDDHSRGIPDLAPVIEPLKQLDRYTDAEIDAAVKTAIWALLVESASGQGLEGIDGQEYLDARKAYYTDNRIDLQEQGGRVAGLFPGDSFKAFDSTRPNTAFEPFVNAAFAQIGVALELPREVLTKVFASSYSAARAALLQATQFFAGRRTWLAANFCQPIYAAFCDEQVAAGRVVAPGYFADPLIRAAYIGSEWIGDAPGHIDEEKAVNAAVARIANNLSTYKRETAALTGEVWEKTYRQREKERRVMPQPRTEPDGARQSKHAEDLDEEDRKEAHA